MPDHINRPARRLIPEISRRAFPYRRPMVYILLTLFSALLFGASTPLSKLLLESLPPFQLAGCLYLGAALGVLPAAVVGLRPLDWFQKKPRQSGQAAGEQPLPQHNRQPMDLKNRLCLTGAVIFGGILGPVAVLYGLDLASAASVAMWLNLEMVATAVLGALVFRDRLGGRGWAGVFGIFAAALVLTWQEGGTGPEALALMAGAGLCWGMDNHLTALIDRLSASQSTLIKGVAAGMTNLIISSGTESFSLDLPLWGAALGLGAFSYGVSICLYILSAQHLGATRSQMVFSTSPFFGVILSVVILGEAISPLQFLAGLVLVFSLTLIFRERHGHAHTHRATAHTHRHTHGDGHHSHGHPEDESGEMDRDEGAHSHWHCHDPERHSHVHWPDLHHRHRH